MVTVAVIPARYGSTRFPGKPLADVGGKPMLQRVYEQVCAAPGLDRVVIATDDERICAAASGFGATAVMTSPACASGTDRVAEAVRDIPADYIVNIQGDQVVMEGAALAAMIAALQSGEAMTTIAVPAAEVDLADPNAVKVVLDRRGYALYFSRAAIPYVRAAGRCPLLKHIGIYGFARRTLQEFTALPPSPLELTESLEQLRALENGIPIKVVVSRGRFHEINTPEDRERLVEKL